jgi:myo-inositol-1(or 4)-monophosphatase
MIESNMDKRLEELREVAEQAARSAGRLLCQMQNGISAREKGPADLVTEADLAAQRAIRSILLEATPQFGFVGEEDDEHRQEAQGDGTEFCWIVDPLDGTTNYVHGLDNYCVSVALRRASRVVLGIVFDPVREEMYAAIEGKGACMNGRVLETSSQRRMDLALLAASFAARVPRNSPEIGRFVEVLHRCQAVRRLGSAALNLCYVAAGRLDGYWATSVKSWDVAAGTLCVQEAGGTVTGLDGSPFCLRRPHLASAATADLHAELLEILARVPD